MRLLRKDPPEDDMPLIQTMASDATRVDMDPVNAILRNQLAEDRNKMMENRVQVGDDFVELPYPTSWTGRADVDSTPYILDLAGIGPLMRGAGKMLFKTGIKEGAESLMKMGSKEALEGVQRKQANDRLQNVADRALRKASQEESQAILNLQGKLDEALRMGRIEESVAEQLFEESVDNIFHQARLDDIVLGETDQLAKNLGPTMEQLYNTDPFLFDELYYRDLITPTQSKKLYGKTNPLMNQFGGRVRVVKNNDQ